MFARAVIFLLIGIFNRICLYLGGSLLFVDVILCLIEQLHIRKTMLTESDNEDFKSFQDAILSEGDWKENLKKVIEEKAEDN